MKGAMSDAMLGVGANGRWALYCLGLALTLVALAVRIFVLLPARPHTYREAVAAVLDRREIAAHAILVGQLRS
jgi:hypothetical protein